MPTTDTRRSRLPLLAVCALFLLSVAPLALEGCGFGDLPCQPGAASGSCQDVESQVEPIVTKYCGSCHSDPPVNGAPGGFVLDDYDAPNGIESKSARVLDRALNGTMPPSGLPAPTDAELDVLRQWEGCQCEAESAMP